jgi:hypothetical protein
MPLDEQPGGAPGTAQREPGWYDDPWNAANIRRWDGEEWTGETAPKPTASPTAPNAPGAAAAPNATRRVRVNPLVAVGVAAAIAVIAGVVVLSGHSAGPSSSATTVPTGGVTPTTAAPIGLPSAVLAATDVGGGWTAVETRPLTAKEYTQGRCGSALWAHDTAGYRSSFVKGASAATAHGSISAEVFEAATLDVAQQQESLVEAAAYGTCLQQTIVFEVQSQLPPGQQVVGATVTPFSLHMTMPTRAFVVDVTVSLPGGGRRVVTDNAVAMFSGRYMATVDVSWSSDAPLGSEIVQQQSQFEATRLTALTAAG